MKRMLIQPSLVSDLGRILQVGTMVYISTDSARAIKWMVKCFDANASYFSPLLESEILLLDSVDGALCNTEVVAESRADGINLDEERGGDEDDNQFECSDNDESSLHEEAQVTDLEDSRLMDRYAAYFLKRNPLVSDLILA
jgi:hypothetical protein